MSNQVCCFVRREALDNISLCFEKVWIIHCKIALCDGGVKGLEKLKGNGMSRPRGSGADCLIRDRKIQAHNSVFEKPNSTRPDRLSDNGAQRRVQERPSALSRFPPKFLSLVNPDRNMDELPRKLFFATRQKAFVASRPMLTLVGGSLELVFHRLSRFRQHQQENPSLQKT